MAINPHNFYGIVKDFHSRNEYPHGKLLTLSKYDINLNSQFICDTYEAFGWNDKANCTPPDFPDDKWLFKSLGFDSFESMDYSDYEGASILHDLNNPAIPEEYREKYDCILDGGTFEHVANIMNALECVFKMLKTGGRFYFDQPVFFGINHGFFNISPCFYYEYFLTNNYEINDLRLFEYENGQCRDMDISMDNMRCGDIPIRTGNAYLLWGSVTKTHETTGDKIPYQYSFSNQWDAHEKQPKTNESKNSENQVCNKQIIEDLAHTLYDAKSFLESKIKQGALADNMSVIKNIVLAVETVYREVLEHGYFIDIDIVNLKTLSEILVSGEMSATGQDNKRVIADFIQAIGDVIHNCMKLLVENEEGNISTCINAVDRDFYKLIAYIKETSPDEIKSSMKKNLSGIKVQDENIYSQVLHAYNDILLWGRIEPENGVFDLIDNRVDALKEHYTDLLWLYSRLGDCRSKRSFLGVIDNWLTFNPQSLTDIQDRTFKHYFDLDIIHCDENEIFVDVGAFVGDTVEDYLHSYNSGYKQMYCYEIYPHAAQILKDRLKDFHRIDIRQKGASDKAGHMCVSDAPYNTMHKLSDTGEIQVETVAIDDDITEPVTFIKMDIEGGEQDALAGCRRHIEKEHPKLAISVYHNNEDIWKCARIIDEMNPNYQFYFRYYGGNAVPVEYVLLAI